MKRTTEDQQFGAEFAKQIRPFYDEAIAKGQTETEFARRIGVNRGGLLRYLRKHAMPSHRTIVLAYREFGIAIPYASVQTGPLVSTKARRRRNASDLQMDLPLTIEAPEGEISVVIKKKTAQRYRLQLHVRKQA